MDPATSALLIRLVIVPIIAELLERRGINGVTQENIEAFAKDPEGILKLMQESSSMQVRVVKDVADTVDFFANGIVDAFGLLFAAKMTGEVGSDAS